MTNATKTLSGLFLLSILILILHTLFSGTGESEIFDGELIVAETEQVNRITIENAADTTFLELSKGENGWQLFTENETYSADSQKVNMALRELQTMEVEALLTRDPQQHPRYRVDSTGTTITLFENQQELDRVITSSSTSPGGSNDIFIRFPGENEVYSVEGLNRSSIQSNFNYWRDLTVWIEQASEMQEIRFTYPADSSFTIVKENEAWFFRDRPLDSQKMNTLSNMLSVLLATGFPPEGIDSSVTDPLYTIEFVLESGEIRELDFYSFEEAEPAPLYLARANGYPYTFTLAKRTWDQGVLLSRDELLAE